MRIRYVRWRNACFLYIQQHGPTDIRTLCEVVRPMQSPAGVPNANSGSQVLKADPRFFTITRAAWVAMGNRWPNCKVWGVEDED